MSVSKATVTIEYPDGTWEVYDDVTVDEVVTDTVAMGRSIRYKTVVLPEKRKRG